MRLAVVGDEIGTSIEEQIESLKEAKINKIEIRKIDDKYLWEFSKEELYKFKEILDKNKIKVLTIDSPVGKKPIPYSRKVELFDIYLEICEIFNNEYLRIFSNLGENMIEEEIKENIKIVCEKASKRKIKLIMENERATYAKCPSECLKLIEKEKNIDVLCDLENAFFEGYDIYDSYEKAKQRIKYIHLRDFDIKNNCYACLGKGDFDIEKFLKKLKEDNYNGEISIETHLPMNNSGRTKRELFIDSIKSFYEIIKKLEIEVE